MDKKQYVLKVLELLQDSLPLARWLIFMIKNTDVDDNLLNILIKASQDSMESVKDEDIPAQLLKLKTFLEELKKTNSQKLDTEDITHLDAMLADI